MSSGNALLLSPDSESMEEVFTAADASMDEVSAEEEGDSAALREELSGGELSAADKSCEDEDEIPRGSRNAFELMQKNQKLLKKHHGKQTSMNDLDPQRFLDGEAVISDDEDDSEDDYEENDDDRAFIDRSKQQHTEFSHAAFNAAREQNEGSSFDSMINSKFIGDDGQWLFPAEYIVAVQHALVKNQNTLCISKRVPNDWIERIVFVLRTVVYKERPFATAVLSTSKVSANVHYGGTLFSDWTGIPDDIDGENDEEVDMLVQRIGDPSSALNRTVLNRYKRVQTMVMVGMPSWPVFLAFDKVASSLRKSKDMCGGIHLIIVANPSACPINHFFLSKIFNLMFRSKINLDGDEASMTNNKAGSALHQLRLGENLDERSENWFNGRIRRMQPAEKHSVWGRNGDIENPSEMTVDEVVITCHAVAEKINYEEMRNLIRPNSVTGGQEHNMFVSMVTKPKRKLNSRKPIKWVPTDLSDRQWEIVNKMMLVKHHQNFCVGAQVMLTRSIPKLPAGSVGIIVNFANDDCMPVVRFSLSNNSSIQITIGPSGHILTHESVGMVCVKAIPLILAWAVDYAIPESIALDTVVFVDVETMFKLKVPLSVVFDGICNPEKNLMLSSFSMLRLNNSDIYPHNTQEWKEGRNLVSSLVKKVQERTAEFVSAIIEDEMDEEEEEEDSPSEED